MVAAVASVEGTGSSEGLTVGSGTSEEVGAFSADGGGGDTSDAVETSDETGIGASAELADGVSVTTLLVVASGVDMAASSAAGVVSGVPSGVGDVGEVVAAASLVGCAIGAA